MNTKCIYCGNRVPRHGKKDARLVTEGGVHRRVWDMPNPMAGKPKGWIGVYSNGLFCTTRCAAKYGIEAARRRGHK